MDVGVLTGFVKNVRKGLAALFGRVSSFCCASARRWVNEDDLAAGATVRCLSFKFILASLRVWSSTLRLCCLPLPFSTFLPLSLPLSRTAFLRSALFLSTASVRPLMRSCRIAIIFQTQVQTNKPTEVPNKIRKDAPHQPFSCAPTPCAHSAGAVSSARVAFSGAPLSLLCPSPLLFRLYLRSLWFHAPICAQGRLLLTRQKLSVRSRMNPAQEPAPPLQPPASPQVSTLSTVRARQCRVRRIGARLCWQD
jgi:hypothetical protein